MRNLIFLLLVLFAFESRAVGATVGVPVTYSTSNGRYYMSSPYSLVYCEIPPVASMGRSHQYDRAVFDELCEDVSMWTAMILVVPEPIITVTNVVVTRDWQSRVTLVTLTYETQQPVSCGVVNCTACCLHTCTGIDPSAHGPCDGTGGPGGCSCHQCECGACCRCKCVCGQWPVNNFCLHTCYHVCPYPESSCPCQNVGYAHEYVHCECHHDEDDDDEDDEDEDCDCEDKGCCEHHGRIVEELEKIRKELEKTEAATDPGALAGVGAFSNVGGISSGVNTHLPLPSNSLNFDSPSSDAEKSPLRFFERPALGSLPRFDTEIIFGELKEKLGDKIPIGELEGLTGDGGDGSWDAGWKIDFTWYGHRFGPWEFDVQPHVDEFARSEIGGWIRLLALFFIATVFIFAVCGLFFDVA